MQILIKELDDVLLRDVGDKIKDSGKYVYLFNHEVHNINVIENCHDCILLLTMSYLSCCRWPLIIDRSSQAATFLRYRDTNYLNTLNTKEMEPNKVRLSLLGAIR